MPFDSTVVEDVTVTRRKQLVEALRDPKLAEHHKWDFSAVGGATRCGSAGCAMGLARTMWSHLLPSSKDIEDWFGLPTAVAVDVFADPFGRTYGGVELAEVTPLMVADALEATYANG